MNGAPEARDVILRAEVRAGDPDAGARLAEALATEPLALVAVFASPEADLARLADDLRAALGPRTVVIGCTTAGEISAAGYVEGTVQAVGFPADLFAAEAISIPDLRGIDTQRLIDHIVQERVALTERARDMPAGFAFLLIDGLSLREDVLASTIAHALADMPLFGGSAGDGTRFERTLVYSDGRAGGNRAVLVLVRSRCPARVFTLNHLEPGASRMVVTDADPQRRIVKTINAEPAAREYARIVGKDPDQLDPFIFAAHPVVVRIGGSHHVRAIQRVNAAGELVFFSAIDEGMVLTVADSRDMAGHLEAEFERMSARRQPAAILACDCILRRIEAEKSQSIRAVSRVLAAHRVTGFSTYGEQIGPLHVNQTMTGVALYPPEGVT